MQSEIIIITKQCAILHTCTWNYLTVNTPYERKEFKGCNIDSSVWSYCTHKDNEEPSS